MTYAVFADASQSSQSSLSYRNAENGGVASGDPPSRKCGVKWGTRDKSPSNSSGFSPPLRKIFVARTTAYCAYGPVSPKKLSASLKSNAITDGLVNFSMK